MFDIVQSMTFSLTEMKIPGVFAFCNYFAYRTGFAYLLFPMTASTVFARKDLRAYKLLGTSGTEERQYNFYPIKKYEAVKSVKEVRLLYQQLLVPPHGRPPQCQSRTAETIRL